MIEVAGGVDRGGDSPEFEFGDEAILEGAVDPFGSATGLGGIGEDQSDAQLLHGAFKLGWLFGTLGNVEAAVAGGRELGSSIEIKQSRQALVQEDM